MRQLLTILFAAVSLGLTAQNNFIQEYPWNPDSDNDDFIGVGDLTGFLSVFGQQFGTPPEPCDYDGTPLEDWLSGIITSDIILDSMFVEFQLLDSSLVYYPGCPDPVMEVVELNFSEMMTNVTWTTSGYSGQAYGGQVLRISSSEVGFYFGFHYSGALGRYSIQTRYQELSSSGYEIDGFFGTSNVIWSDGMSLPFEGVHVFDENGLSFDPSIWSSNEWPFYANVITMLPYWHYAE